MRVHARTCVFIFCYLSFLNLYAGDIESPKEINILESSSEPVCLSTGKEDQNNNISEIPNCARCSQCLKQVMSLTVLYLHINR